MILWNYLRKKMLETPYQIVCEGNASMTYEELCAFAEIRAEQMTDDNYGILCESEMATAMSLLSCIAAGKTAIPMPYRYGQEAYFKIFSRAAPSSLITDLSGELNIVKFDTPVINDTEAAVVLFTSGSTGVPKGVMLSEENLLANIKDISSYFPINKNDTILISRPLYHSSVLTGEFLVSLCNGAKIVFSSEPFQPLNILRLMKEKNITVFGSTPTLMSAFSRFVRNTDKLSVRLLSISGECMTEGMAKTIRKAFPNSEVYCGYGLSEASPRVAYLSPRDFDNDPTSAGNPLPSVKVRIVDKDGRNVAAEQIGELIVRGPNVMLGYFADEAQSKSAIKRGWLHTGDLAVFGKDGKLYIKGRKDDMIIRAGMNIYPAEIENALSADERVNDVFVYGYEENGTREIGMKISGNFENLDQVMELCRTRLSPYQIPKRVQLIEKTEMLSGGKKQRK